MSDALGIKAYNQLPQEQTPNNLGNQNQEYD
jgi:hypothetical protein